MKNKATTLEGMKLEMGMVRQRGGEEMIPYDDLLRREAAKDSRHFGMRATFKHEQWRFGNTSELMSAGIS